MKNIRLIVLLFLSINFFPLYAQKQIKGFPSDFKSAKVIFLEYEQLPIDPSWPKMLINNYTMRNKEAEKANKMLAEMVKKYPYPYTISKRSVYKNLLDNGFRYALENDMMLALNNGEEMHRAFVTYESPMYLIDLKTGDRYELFTMSQTHVYDYKWIMEKFINKVKREFK